MFESAVSFLREKCRAAGVAPKVALLLGSGMGGALSGMKAALSIPYADVPGLPVPRVQGHAGCFDAGEAAGVPVAVFRGRFHLYEGLMPMEVAAPAILAKALGASALLQASAAGGVGKAFAPGALALVRDHLNLTGRDPLAGIPVEERAPAFTDMTDAYPAALRKSFKDAARRLKIPLHEGVLAVTHGPSYETPAEVGMLQKAGADAVCMSGACESAFARYVGLPVAFLLVITNRAAGLSKAALSHDDVVARAKKSEARLSALLEAALPGLAASAAG